MRMIRGDTGYCWAPVASVPFNSTLNRRREFRRLCAVVCGVVLTGDCSVHLDVFGWRVLWGRAPNRERVWARARWRGRLLALERE